MSEAAGGTGARQAGGFGRWLAGRTLRGRLLAGVVALQHNEKPYTRTLPTLGTYRLMAVSGQDGVVYVSGLPLSAVSTTMSQVELTEVAVFSAALLLTGIIGTGFVRLSLRPLRRVTAPAAQGTRLPPAGGAGGPPNRGPDADPATAGAQLGPAFSPALVQR